MQRQVPEVFRDVVGQLAEEAHHQRGAGVVRRRIDTSLGQIRTGNLQG